jgi:hypothetical protein
MIKKPDNYVDKRSENGKKPHHKTPLWKKGQSGNPAGKPKGCGALSWFNTFIKSRREDILNSIVDRAMHGNSTAMELVVTRMIPSFQPADEAINLEGFKEAKTRTERAQVVSDGVSSGVITPNQGVVIMTVLEKAAKIQEVDDLANRIEAIEKTVKKNKD